MKKLLSVFFLFTISLSAQSYVGNILKNSNFDCVTDSCQNVWERYRSTGGDANRAFEKKGDIMYASQRKYPSYWGSHGLKIWGHFNGSNNESSHFQTFQDVPVGKQVTVSGVTMTYNEDRITGGNQAFLFIKFFGDGYSFISGAFSDSLDKDSPADKWIPLHANATVPSGTKYTQVGIGYYQNANDGAGVYFDDMVSYIGDTKITINVNTSHIQGISPRKLGSMVDLRGGSVGTGTGVIANPAWNAGTNLKSAGGDNWKMDIALDNNLVYDFKFGGHIPNLDGTISGYWENDLPGANYSGDNFKMDLSSNTETSKTVTHYLGRGPSNDTPPYTANTDSIDVFFRVNMSNNLDFNPATQKVHMAGDLESEMTGGGDWSHGIVMTDLGGGFYGYHWKGAKNADAPVTLNYKFTLGDWSGTHEDGLTGPGIVGGNRQVIVNSDTTIHWVWYNNNPPSPFTASSKVPSLTFRTNIGQAIANNGWKDGDLLLVKWGYGRTADKVYVDTLTAGVGGDYQATIAPTDSLPVDSKIGMYYQYYRSSGGSDSREIFFNFDTTWKDVSLQERRWTTVTGGAPATIVDYVPSKTHGRRLPVFQNSTKLDANAADTDSLLVTWTVDLRPAYYQLLSYGSDTADSLKGIQGAKTLYYSDRDSLFKWGVWMNGPAIGGWNIRGAWGSGLRTDSLAMMHDDGTHGDATAGDSIYTVQFKYQKNSTNVGMEFKFGINGEDNESGFGLNHIENIDSNNPTVASQFGSINPNRYNAWNFDKGAPGTLSVEELVGVPDQFELSNNYPNPFNPTTSINFNIPIASEVVLTIYNITGQEVAKIHNGYAQAGSYKAVWNGMDNLGNKAPSGVYFYELKAENHFHKVKKMTLLK
tara:strand:- start:91 stop:2703 length:2613 start_codon:yes stop_codon:yes gene_type:complete